MRYLAAIILLASCVPRAIVVKPISEQAAVVSGKVERIKDHANTVERATVVIGKDVKNLREQVSQANDEAERLRKAGKATQRELDANAAAWRESQRRAQELLSTADGLRLDVSVLQTAINDAKTETAKMTKEARDLDAAVRKLEARIVAMTPDYELGKTVRHWFWGIVAVVILTIIGFIVLIVLNRSARAALSVATHGIIPP